MTKHLIFLASGNAVRFGSNKLLAPFQGKPLYLHGLEQLVKVAREDPTCIVTVVSQYPEIRDMAQKLDVRAVDCPDSVKGMSHSIRAGIRALQPCKNEDFLMFVCADQPYLCAESIRKLLEKAVSGTKVARLFCGDCPGNPVLFSAELIPELLELTGDQGGGVVIRRYPCIRVPVENPRELMDIDSEEDLQNQQI